MQGEKRDRYLGGKVKVRTGQRVRNKVKISREGGKMNRERESVFALGSVGDDKTEASSGELLVTTR